MAKKKVAKKKVAKKKVAKKKTTKRKAIKKVTKKVTKKAAKKAAKKAVKKAVKKVVKKATKKVAKSSNSAKKKTNTPSISSAEYKIFSESSVRDLEDQVNYHMKKGWQPIGGVIIQEKTGMLLQTMLRHS